jgi:hypothetical protein
MVEQRREDGTEGTRHRGNSRVCRGYSSLPAGHLRAFQITQRLVAAIAVGVAETSHSAARGVLPASRGGDRRANVGSAIKVS